MSDLPLYDIAKRSIEIGWSLGADQVESYVIYGSLKSVLLEKGSIHHFTDTSSSGIGVRVIKNKSIGMASTTVFSSEEMRELTFAPFPSSPNPKPTTIEAFI